MSTSFLEQVVASAQTTVANLQQQQNQGQTIPQPDANGEFATPADGAVWMATVHRKRQTPLNGKAAFMPNWQETASVDPVQIRKWAAEHPGCNFGSVADGGLVFEADSPEVRKRFSGSFSNTLTIASSEGKGHRYYLPADVEHIAQNATKHGDFSLRKQNAYCVSPGSVHPTTQKQYQVAINVPIVVPTAEEITFWKSERVEKQSAPVQSNDESIPSGKRNSTITSILGKAREATGANYDALLALAEQHNERCLPPLSDRELQTIAHSIARYEYKPAPPVIMGGKVLGQQPVARVDSPKFVSVGELEQGEVQMLIDGFLPEGTIFIGGLPGEGKTLFALSITRALTTGKPFLNGFNVPKKIPVIYLIPESGGRAFRKRCERFQIPDNPELFLCRTVSQGATLPLDDASLLEAVARLKPVVILDTVIRFSESEDENAAAQNKQLVDDVIRLRQAGAIAVIGLHHATKKMRTEGMSLELALRGTGDIAASADAVYGLLRDNMLYNNGEGPNEIQVACLKPRDFEPPAPFRIASSRKLVNPGPGFTIGTTESIIDQQHDFQLVSRLTHANQVADRIEKLVLETPTITMKELNLASGVSVWEIRKTLERLGYHRGRGGKKGATHWTKEPEKVDLSTIRVDSDELPGADVDLEAEAA
jgi:hypothetical protein